MNVTVLGSCLEADIPYDFNKFFKNGFGYDQRFDIFQEMDSYYLYMLLKAFDYKSIALGSNLNTLKKKCFESAYDRLNDEFEWHHGHWSKKYNETHCRFSSAGIRLLVERYREYPDEEFKQNILHVTESLTRLSEKLNIGLWFYHDSLEICDRTISDYPMKNLKTRIFGKSTHNTLTLNTHIDTLITLFDVKKTLNTTKFDREIEDGIAALDYVLKYNNFELFLYPVAILQFIFFRYDSNRLYYILKQIAVITKKILPSFTLPNGYIERELALKNFAFNYHVFNIWDFCKLERYYSSKRIKQIIENGFNFIFNTPYIDFYIKRKIPGGIVICESILIHLSVNEISDYELWMERYLKVRKNYAPSSAIIGYDSIVIPEELRIPPDDIPVRNHELDVLNISKFINKFRYIITNPSNIEIFVSYNTKTKYAYDYYDLFFNSILPPKTVKPDESYILEVSTLRFS